MSKEKKSKQPKKKRSGKKQHKLILHRLQPDDYTSFCEAMDAAYPTLGGSWHRDQFLSQIARFPDGQICIADSPLNTISTTRWVKSGLITTN